MNTEQNGGKGSINEQPTIKTLPTLPTIPKMLAVQGRKAVSVTAAPSGYEGEGFPVKRAFAGVSDAALDPFIHMDEMGSVEYAPGEPRGTAWHPHRGFETFTYLIHGEFLHQDSHGGGGAILPGGTQYMTAGDGILHIETPPEHLVTSGGLFHGVQLWINLPSKLKRTTPAYQDLQGETTLLTTPDGGGVIRVLAGEIAGVAGPGISHTPLAVTHVTLGAGAQAVIPWPKEYNALAYAMEGSGEIGTTSAPLSAGQLAVLTGGENITIKAGKAPMEIFLIGGKPLRERIEKMGPFVMNTRVEILEAINDYHTGRFGEIPPGALQPFHAR
jgi:redox-sensitive bicupin YhaK (pirin superfamily)